LSTLSTYLDALRTQAAIPGLAVAVVDRTSLVWSQSFGLQDVAAAVSTRTDTPFHFDGLTQLITATMVLQCVEEGRVLLDSPIRGYSPKGPYAAFTIRQVLTHTVGPPGHLTFAYDLNRWDALRYVVQTCKATTFRWAFRDELQRVSMMDSVPGLDAASSSIPTLERATPVEAARYLAVLGRLATSYNTLGTVAVAPHPDATLGAASGLISTVLDFAKFDLALKTDGLLLQRSTLVAAWSAPVNSDGTVLPHGLGWFVQTYKGEPIVWQFGLTVNASSSLLITLPKRGVTVILVANSDGLTRPDSLKAGDVTVSPFGRVVLGLFVK
jgi:CubicO group peptidase (beta-lactamase class C family)